MCGGAAIQAKVIVVSAPQAAQRLRLPQPPRTVLGRFHNSYSDYYGPQNTQMTQKRRRNFFFFSAGIPCSADKNIMEDFPLKNEEGWPLLSFLRFSACSAGK
jgi:hypothetical protein